MSKLTPMMQQYLETKDAYPDAILFFQLGDFYETFFEDAELAARELDIVLTKRDETPMAGVPIKKVDTYINRLLKRGHKVAVCDQVQSTKDAKGMVAREVTRVVTPGTVLEADALEPGKQNYLAAVVRDASGWALAVCDASTGEFKATSVPTEEALWAELGRLSPSELLLPSDLALQLPAHLERASETRWPQDAFSSASLTAHFEMGGVEGLAEGECRAAGGLFSYLKATQRSLGHLRLPAAYAAGKRLRLDPFTVRNLELVRELRDGGTRATLLGVLNVAVTGMGQRLLRHRLLNPLTDRDEIGARLDLVETLSGAGLLRGELRETLKEVHDVERLVGRLGAGRASPRDLLALQQSLAQLPDLWLKAKELLGASPHDAARRIVDTLASEALKEVAELLGGALREDAPFALKDGGVIRPDYHPELGKLSAQEAEARDRILALEAQERELTGIGSLKVGYNSVFGYFLEVSKAQSQRVPPHYHRKQTLTNAERYITPELKELEEKSLAAQERSRELEYELFVQVRQQVAQSTQALQALARAVAELDAYAALAEVAQRRDYVRPELCSEPGVEIVEGRHPVVETLVQGQSFVPNDLSLDRSDRLVVLTGPNMSGKSTYLRQVALIALMAQMGSFVPAKQARLPVFDQVFTRVGASDMLAGGYSTFMVEMLETANILNHATERSLVLLDEMGRGTSTFDGVSIAWAVAEYLVKETRPMTLFATHYHELTQLADQLAGVVNLHVRVKEQGGEVVFMHRVAPGAAEGSYGVHVARLAGLPERVTREAEALLERILATRPLEGMDGTSSHGPRFARQLALFTQEDHPVLQSLRALDVNQLTPMEALSRLSELKAQLDDV